MIRGKKYIRVGGYDFNPKNPDDARILTILERWDDEAKRAGSKKGWEKERFTEMVLAWEARQHHPTAQIDSEKVYAKLEEILTRISEHKLSGAEPQELRETVVNLLELSKFGL